MRTFLLLFLLIVMILGTSVNAKDCNCKESVVKAHACCNVDVVQKSDPCAQCSCDMSHSIAIVPIKIESAQALHVRIQYSIAKTFLTQSGRIPLFEPPKFLS